MWNDLISIIPAVGALIVAALSLSSHLPRWRKWLIGCLTAVMVVAAGWNQWSSTREESAERAVAETRQKHIAQLKSFYVEADNLFVKEITVANNKDVNGYKQLSAELDAYSKQLENWVHANMGPAAKEHLLRLPTAPPLTFSFAINQDQNSELNALISIRQSIDDLIANPTWDEAKRTQCWTLFATQFSGPPPLSAALVCRGYRARFRVLSVSFDIRHERGGTCQPI